MTLQKSSTAYADNVLLTLKAAAVSDFLLWVHLTETLVNNKAKGEHKISGVKHKVRECPYLTLNTLFLCRITKEMS